VLGSVLAISIAINYGFRMTMLAGVCVYAVALATSQRLAGGTLPSAVRETTPTRRAAVA
jgi:hypothetical protein